MTSFSVFSYCPPCLWCYFPARGKPHVIKSRSISYYNNYVLPPIIMMHIHIKSTLCFQNTMIIEYFYVIACSGIMLVSPYGLCINNKMLPTALIDSAHIFLYYRYYRAAQTS